MRWYLTVVEIHISLTEMMLGFFLCAYQPLLCDVSVQIHLSLFSYWVVLLNFKSSLYILDRSPLTICIVNIFSQPVVCLCTLLRVSLKTKIFRFGEAQCMNFLLKESLPFISCFYPLLTLRSKIFGFSGNLIVVALISGQIPWWINFCQLIFV